MIYLYVLLAIATTDQQPGSQTIGYYATMKECIVDRNRLEPSINKTYVRLDCVPIKVYE